MVRSVRRKRPRTLIDRGSQEHSCQQARTIDLLTKLRLFAHGHTKVTCGHATAIKIRWKPVTRIGGRWGDLSARV